MSNDLTGIQAAFLRVLVSFAAVIERSGAIHADELYSMVRDHLTMDEFAELMGVLVERGLVDWTPDHILRWVGPFRSGVPTVN